MVCGSKPSASATLLGDVGDAGREHTRVAGHFFVDDVGNLVRGGAELGGRDRIDHRHQWHLLDHVDQREADLDAAIGERARRADDDGVRPLGAPCGRLHVLDARRPRRDAGRIDQPEEARTREIGAGDVRDAGGAHGLAVERDHRDGHRGTRATDDLDGELRAYRCQDKQGNQAEEAGKRAVPEHFVVNFRSRRR
jgi:hypothetical protein